MYSFKDETNKNVNEVVRMSYKIMVDEINYINKLLFVYSMLKEKHPEFSKENLHPLVKELKGLKDLKDDFLKKLDGKYEVESVDRIMSLSELSNFAKDLISDDLEETIDNIVEEFHVNNAYIENIIDELSDIEDEALAGFIEKIESVNNRAMEYIARSIKNTNRR